MEKVRVCSIFMHNLLRKQLPLFVIIEIFSNIVTGCFVKATFNFRGYHTLSPVVQWCMAYCVISR